MEDNSEPCPPCFLYNHPSGKWQSFESLSITIKGKSSPIFSYTNKDSQRKTTIKKEITYDYIVQFSRVIPKEHKPSQSMTRSTFSAPSVLQECAGCGESNEPLHDLKIQNIIILKDPECNNHILLGFLTKKPKFDENNKEVKHIRYLLSKLHWELKYNKEALIYQLTERFKVILKKIIKHSLSYVARLYDIPSAVRFASKLGKLYDFLNPEDTEEENTRETHLNRILEAPLFIKEVTSITYKIIATIGLFPTHIELNTMDEYSLLLTIKSLFTSPTNAPYGSRHHASFTIGSLRYSFVNVSRDPERQRVYTTDDLQRTFKINKHEYFRVKFFDFFPMDNWVETLAAQAVILIQRYFVSTRMLTQYDFGAFWRGSVFPEDTAVCEDIASRFFEKYRSEVDEAYNGGMFRKITDTIADADVRGYESLHSNCQTIVSDALDIMLHRLRRFITPLCDMSKISYIKSSWEKEYLQEFLKFGSEFNWNFESIAPFPLKYKMSYFDIYSDKDTCELMNPKNFKNLQKCIEKFQKREKIQGLVQKFEKYLQSASKIPAGGEENEERKLPDIKLEEGENFSIISCLLMLTYNDLFVTRRQIKIEKTRLDLVIDTQSKRASLKSIDKRLDELYEKKYKLAELYKELSYYYYNSVRLELKLKVADKTSCIGFLIARKPSDGTI